MPDERGFPLDGKRVFVGHQGVVGSAIVGALRRRDCHLLKSERLDALPSSVDPMPGLPLNSLFDGPEQGADSRHPYRPLRYCGGGVGRDPRCHLHDAGRDRRVAGGGCCPRCPGATGVIPTSCALSDR